MGELTQEQDGEPAHEPMHAARLLRGQASRWFKRKRWTPED
jgi:hypothetical protein